MPQLIRHGPGNWTNYHETVDIWAEEQFELSAGSEESALAEDYLGATAALAKSLLADAVNKFADVRPLGGSWSFSELNKTDGSILQTLNSGKVFALRPDQLGPGAPPDPGTLVLAAGGTRIGELNEWLEPNGLSLKTSGASDGQSLAGAMATATHGSVPSIGGIQNQVRAVQLVVSPTETVWVEPSGPGLLTDTFLQRFNDRIERDDALFGAAVVHLGGLGYVNAVLLEVAPIYLVEMIQRKVVIDQDWLAELEAGDFRAVARRLGYDEDPYFYQVIIDPFAPMQNRALHRMLLKRPAPGPEVFVETAPRVVHHLIDPLMLLAEIFEAFPLIRGPAIGVLMETMYRTMPRDPAHPTLQSWAETTPPHKNVGKLFSTGFAFPRERLREALGVMFRAFDQAGGGDVVTTLRFVGKAEGTLAFTRFENNVVVDFDGFRSDASRTVTQAAIAALEAAQIPFSRHWGKMAPITAAIVARDYGQKVAAWRAARERLLPEEVRQVFASTALRSWGLA